MLVPESLTLLGDHHSLPFELPSLDRAFQQCDPVGERMHLQSARQGFQIWLSHLKPLQLL